MKDMSGTIPHSALSQLLEIAEAYKVIANVKFGCEASHDLLLDAYLPKVADRSAPTLLNFHGGGWMGEFTRADHFLRCLPFLNLGWNVFNADYRPSSVASAPAAVEDCVAALRWVYRYLREQGLASNQIVLMGHSAGGHLALTTGMIPQDRPGYGAPSQYLDMYDPGTGVRIDHPTVRASAIINWFGITDVAALVEGDDLQPFAVKWIGNRPDAQAIAHSVSPLEYVDSTSPPVVTVHGTADSCVPYRQAVRFHQALAAANVPNQLLSVEGGGHGLFGTSRLLGIYEEIFRFLIKAGVRVFPDPSGGSHKPATE